MPILDVALLDPSESNEQHHKLVAVNFKGNARLLGYDLHGRHELLVELLEHNFLSLIAQLILFVQVFWVLRDLRQVGMRVRVQVLLQSLVLFLVAPDQIVQTGGVPHAVEEVDFEPIVVDFLSTGRYLDGARVARIGRGGGRLELVLKATSLLSLWRIVGAHVV